MARNALIQIRRDTASNWTSTNPTLASGEMGFETDTGKLKIGTGSTAWTSLSYVSSEVAGVFITGDSSNNTITISTSAPSGGNDGDVWMVYS